MHDFRPVLVVNVTVSALFVDIRCRTVEILLCEVRESHNFYISPIDGIQHAKCENLVSLLHFPLLTPFMMIQRALIEVAQRGTRQRKFVLSNIT